MVLCRVATTRGFSTGFKPKTFKEAWLSDSGAYPVMAVIAGACVFCASASFYILFSHPDNRLSKPARKGIFRGELAGSE